MCFPFHLKRYYHPDNLTLLPDKFDSAYDRFSHFEINQISWYTSCFMPYKLFFKLFKKEVLMSLVKRNGNIFTPLPTFFDDFFNRDVFNWNNSNFSDTDTTVPAVNIKETAENYEVEVAAPGMTKNDFKVELDGNVLIISSEKSNQKEDMGDEKYSRKEFSYQAFRRTLNLQKDVVDIDRIQAKYENGLLHLVIPKKEEAKQKPPRLIEIA